MNPTDYQPQEPVHGHAPDEGFRFCFEEFDDSLRLDWLRSAAADTLIKPLGLSGTFGAYLTELTDGTDWYWPSITIMLSPELSALDVLRLVAQASVQPDEHLHFSSLEIDASARTMNLIMCNRDKNWDVYGDDIKEAAKAIVGLTLSRPVPDMADRFNVLTALLKTEWRMLDQDDLDQDVLDQDDLMNAACAVAEMLFGQDYQSTEHGRDVLIIRTTLQQVFTRRMRRRILEALAAQRGVEGTDVSGPSQFA